MPGLRCFYYNLVRYDYILSTKFGEIVCFGDGEKNEGVCYEYAMIKFNFI